MPSLGVLLSAVGCLTALATAAAPPAGYYALAEGKAGGALRSALHDIIKGHRVIPYSSSATNDTMDALSFLDADPLNTNNVILIYSRRSEPKTNFSAGVWNREHLWPNSYGIDSHVPAYSDLFNLRPEDANVNNARGNLFFDLSNTNDPGYQNPGFAEAPFTTRDSDSWEPPASVRGDIARAMFYMDVRYAGTEGTEPDLLLTDITASISSTTNRMGKLTTLVRWHWADPVDESERLRNDRIYELYQRNRNPFVDHPEWVELVYGISRPRLAIEFVANPPPPPFPDLGTLLRVRWPTNQRAAILEQAPHCSGPWAAYPFGPNIIGSDYAVIFFSGTNEGGYFFRLRIP